MRVFVLLTVTAFAIGGSALVAHAELFIPWWTIDGGGTTMVSGERLRLAGTIGQPDAGKMAGERLTLGGGFWMGGGAATGIEEGPLAEVGGLRIWAGSPNPFRLSTSIAVDLPEPRVLEATVHDATGRVVRRIEPGLATAGRHSIVWNGRDDAGRRVASGIYLVRVTAGHADDRQTLVLLH